MNRKNIDLTSSASLIFAPILMVAHLYFMGPMSPIEMQQSDVVTSVLAKDLITFQQYSPIIAMIITTLLITLGAMLNVMVTTRYDLFGTASQLPLFLYVCFVVGFASSQDMLSPAIAACVGIFSLRDFFRTYESTSRTSKLFTGCFWMGILPMLYPATITLWVAAFIFMIIFVRSLREIAVVICGLALPFSLYTYAKWLLGTELEPQIMEFANSIITSYSYSPELWNSRIIYRASLASLAGALILVSLMQVEIMSIRFVARTRLRCALILTGLGALMTLLPSFNVESFTAIAAPLSIAVTPAMMRMRAAITIPIFIAIALLAVCFLLPILGL